MFQMRALLVILFWVILRDLTRSIFKSEAFHILQKNIIHREDKDWNKILLHNIFHNLAKHSRNLPYK